MTDLARCTLVKMGEFFGMRGSVSLMGFCGDARGFVRKRTDNEGILLQHVFLAERECRADEKSSSSKADCKPD